MSLRHYYSGLSDDIIRSRLRGTGAYPTGIGVDYIWFEPTFVEHCWSKPMAPSDIYARVFENACTGLLLVARADGRIRQVNSTFLQTCGRRRSEVLGRFFWEPPFIADAAYGIEVHRHLMTGEVADRVELPLATADGRWRIVEVSGRSIDDLIQLEVRDVSGRERAYVAERMESLRSLAGRTAQEFGNLHRELRIMGEQVLVNSGLSGQGVVEFNEIRQAGERAGIIARQLRAFSGQSEYEARPVALNGFIEGMLPRVSGLLGRTIEVVSDLSPDVSMVRADPALLRQIVLSLATNSREAMERGGTFCLQTRNESSVEHGFGVNQEFVGQYCMLAVSDDGPGMDDQSWQHLYEPFFSSHTDSGSLGLGLAAVHGIVRQMEGRLWVYSQLGKGVTFRIYLPQAGPQFTALPEQTDALRGCATILLIERSDGLRSSVAKLLHRHGYRVLEARGSADALKSTERSTDLDLVMGELEPALVERLGYTQPMIRAINWGGCQDDPRGRFRCLLKPFEPQTLLAAVDELLAGK
jgi:two-component system cell cycle sensor histidine kinase/response regulator CckA